MDLRVSKKVKRIVMLQADETGRVVAQTLYGKKKGKRKGTRELKDLEKIVRRVGRAQQAYANAYVDRHLRSSRKKKDGWLRDLGNNVFRASRKAGRKLRVV